MSLPGGSDHRFWILDFRKQSIIYNLKSKISRSWRRGFSLIELLVVITIIALLIGVATVSYTKAQQKGRDGRRKSDLKAIQQALELYFQQNGKYPPNPPTAPDDGIGFCATLSNSSYTIYVRDVLQPSHISKVPSDPTVASTSDYLYYKITNSTYRLFSILENTNDPDRASYVQGSPDIPWGCTPVTYNYKVTNP